MSTRTYYLPRKMHVDFATADPWLYREMASLKGHFDRENSPFICEGNGAPMYVRKVNNRYYFAHYPNESSATCVHPTGMSDEHRRQADYVARAAEDHGLRSELEHATGNHTRLDLAVFGMSNAGFEIQRSELSRARAKARAVKSFNAGWPTAWVTDAPRRPDWADQVPTAALTKGIDWSERLPGRDMARVIIGRFTRIRDRSRPSGWRYQREPEEALLDDLAYLMPAGEIIPVAFGNRGTVSLAFKGAAEIIDSCTYPGASTWRPNGQTPRTREAPQRFTSVCRHESKVGHLEGLLDDVDRVTADIASLRQAVTSADTPTCAMCHRLITGPKATGGDLACLGCGRTTTTRKDG